MQLIAEPADFPGEFSDLYDCMISDAGFSPDRRRLSLSIDDLESNFEGLPDYGGPRPARLVFVNTDATSQTAHSLAGIQIFDLTITKLGKTFSAVLLTEPGQTVTWTFEALELFEPGQ